MMLISRGARRVASKSRGIQRSDSPSSSFTPWDSPSAFREGHQDDVKANARDETPVHDRTATTTGPATRGAAQLAERERLAATASKAADASAPSVGAIHLSESIPNATVESQLASDSCCDALSTAVKRQHKRCITTFTSETAWLKLCAQYGNAEWAETLVAGNKSLLEEKDETRGATALHYAAHEGNMKLITLLVSHGADVNAADGGGVTPLMLASLHSIYAKSAESMVFLAKHGARLDAVNEEEGETALHILCAGGPSEERAPNAALILQLLEAVRSFDDAQWAQQNNKNTSNLNTDAGTRQSLGSEVERIESTSSESGSGGGGGGDVGGRGDVVVEADADQVDRVVRMGDRRGLTPLMLAVAHPRCEETVLRVLCDAFGAPCDTVDMGGGTALHHAVVSGNRETVRALVARGATVDATDRRLTTPLATAVMHSRVGCVQELLTANANPSSMDADGLTPLHLAVAVARLRHHRLDHQLQMVSDLLRHGALATQKSNPKRGFATTQQKNSEHLQSSAHVSPLQVPISALQLAHQLNQEALVRLLDEASQNEEPSEDDVEPVEEGLPM